MAFDTPQVKNLSQIAPALLAWYDENARELPWRVGPKARMRGRKPDPYHVWLSEIMLQQTTVATVAPRYDEFLQRWPNVKAMGAASLDEITGQWAGLGYYARARNLHKCAVIVAQELNGKFPDTEDDLRKLPGIGDYTAAAIAAIAFDKPSIVVDGNIERIVTRLFAIETPMPAAKNDIKKAALELWPQKRSGDFAQALMDLGATVCKPKTPLCDRCPLADDCVANMRGEQAAFPKKPPKKQKPRRRGVVFALRNSKGEILFERRPEKGLLGGMLGLPGSPWETKLAKDFMDHAPVKARWKHQGEATHTFTHFHLTLDVYAASAPKGFRRTTDQCWIAPEDAKTPTAMRKALDKLSS